MAVEASDARKTLNATVRWILNITPELRILHVVPEGWTVPDFEAGQYAVVGLPGAAPRVEGADPEDPEPDPDKLIRRAYSIASASVGHDYLEFYITLVLSGALTPRLFALNEGDRVWLGHRIVGMFTLDQVPPDRDVVLVATGTGIAPYISMIRTYLTAQPDRRFAVLHGARHSWDLGYRSELDALTARYPNFMYIPQISQPAAERVPWKGSTGRVQQLWSGQELEQAWGGHPGPHDAHVFLCGNPAMCEDMVKLLSSEGFREHSRKQPGEIHVERYW